MGDVFRAFEATGSCCGVVKAFRDRRFPTHGQSWTGEVKWMRLRQSQARAILRNPAYAGAYVSGRVKSERTIDAEDLQRIRVTDSAEEAVTSVTDIALKQFGLSYGPRLQRRWWLGE